MGLSKKGNRNAGQEAIQWVTVAETLGTAHTKMLVEYLRENGLRAVAYGSTSLGLLTGANSSARVMVPEEEVETAMSLLEPEAGVKEEEGNDDDTDSSSEISNFHKVVLGATAVAFNPLGAGIAYAVSRAASSGDESVDDRVECPNCGIGFELSDMETTERESVCPECDHMFSLDDHIVCPSCRTEVELDDDERVRGWYICPECRWAIRVEHS